MRKKLSRLSLSLSLSRNHSMSIIMATLNGAERFPSSYSSPTCRRRSRPFRRVFPWIVCVAYVGLCRLLFQFTILNGDVCSSRFFTLEEKKKEEVAPKFSRRTKNRKQLISQIYHLLLYLYCAQQPCRLRVISVSCACNRRKLVLSLQL